GTPGDLKNITAGIAANLTANPTIDPRMKVGRGESVMGIDLDLLGNLYLSWDGQSSATINVEVKEGGYRNAADGMLIVDPNPTFTGGLIELGDVTPPGGVFESTPTGAGGGVLDFGFGPNTRTINLAVRNVGADGSTVVVDDFTITGADASLF